MAWTNKVRQANAGALGILRSLPRQSFPVRLGAWSLLLSVVTVFLSIHIHYSPRLDSAINQLAALAITTASIALIAYAFVKFGERHELRWLLKGIGFLGIAIEGVCDSARVIFQAPLEYQMIGLACAAVGLTLLAYSGTTKIRLTHTALIASAVALGIVAIVVVQLKPLTHFMLTAATNQPYTASTILTIVVGCACVLTAITHGQRFVSDGDRLAGLISYVAITAALATIAGLVEMARPNYISWQPETLYAFSAFLLLIGLGAENGMAQREADEMISEVECLHAISWALVGTETLNSLLTAFAEALCEKLEGSFASVYTVDDETQTVTTAAVYGIEPEAKWLGKSYSLQPQPRKGFHSGHTAKAIASREVQVVPDVFSDAEFISWQMVGKSDGHVVSLPIAEGSGVIAVVNIYFASNTPISENRLKLFKTIAASAAPAIRSVYMAEKDTFDLTRHHEGFSEQPVESAKKAA